MRRWILGFGTWCAALLLTTALFHALGDGSLAPPPLDPSAWGPWIAGREVSIATMALLRLVVLGLCWYLVGVTSLGTVARVSRAARLMRLADAVTLPVVRRLLQQTLGVALATTMITATSGASLAAPALAPVPVAAGVDGGEAPVETTTGPLPSEAATPPRIPARTGIGIARPAQAPAGSRDEVTLRGLPAPSRDERSLLPWRIAGADGARDPGASPGTGSPGSSDAPSLDAEVPGEDGPGVSLRDTDTAGTAHTVRSGESLWRIASHRLEIAFGRPPTDGEIVPYWRELIEVNRERLPDRDDPDLILPGQELLLPELVAP